jgi:hypothetical protein
LLHRGSASWLREFWLRSLPDGRCRAYYFCFYVLEHYADPTFRYAGLLDLFRYLTGFKKP